MSNMPRPMVLSIEVISRNMKGMTSFCKDLVELELVKSPLRIWKSLLASTTACYHSCVTNMPLRLYSVFQTDLPREPDVMLKYVGGIMSWKRTYSCTNIKVIAAHRQLGVHRLTPFSLLDAAGTDSWKIFSVVISLLGKDFASPILPALDDQCAASTLCTFFGEKITTIQMGLEDEENSLTGTLS